MADRKYAIKKVRQGFDLLQDGDWLSTHATDWEAEAEKLHREQFDNRGGMNVPKGKA